jgi:ketosteroid isomerase-like protein
MSQENVEIVRRCCDAFDRGDYEGAPAFLDPEVEYELLHFPMARSIAAAKGSGRRSGSGWGRGTTTGRSAAS